MLLEKFKDICILKSSSVASLQILVLVMHIFEHYVINHLLRNLLLLQKAIIREKFAWESQIFITEPNLPLDYATAQIKCFLLR